MILNLGEVIDVSLTVYEETDAGYILRRYEVRVNMPPAKPGILPSDNSWQQLLIPAFMPNSAEVSQWDWFWDDGAVDVSYGDLTEPI